MTGALAEEPLKSAAIACASLVFVLSFLTGLQYITSHDYGLDASFMNPLTQSQVTSGYTENTMPDYQFVSDEELIGKPYRKDELAPKIRKVLDKTEA
jgi:hypothetical protein